MLSLDHVYHLPELEPLIERLVQESRGLVVVAGLDPRGLGRGFGDSSQARGAEEGFLPSGRTAIFRILMYELLAQHPGPAVVVARDRDAFRVPRRFGRRVELIQVPPDGTYAHSISIAARRAPVLLAIDRLDEQTVPAAFEAAQSGLRVLSQLDTVLTGADAARQLCDLGAPPNQLASLAWIISVQRMMTLCQYCKRQVLPDPEMLEALSRRYPTLDVGSVLAGDVSQAGAVREGYRAGTVYEAQGCAHCQRSGHLGHVACFDVFYADCDPPRLFERPSLLSLERYVLGLASRGYLSLEDALYFEREQLRRTYHLFASSERALADASAALQRKGFELEAANRVLQQRTKALISLQDLGQALIGGRSMGTASGTAIASQLDDLARRVCRHTVELCDADRAVLYLIRPGSGTDALSVEILAVNGWNPGLLHHRIDASPLLPAVTGADAAGMEPQPFHHLPPGVSAQQARGVALYAGLCVPLVAHQERVGWMVVHTTEKRAFSPGAVALLQAYANQAALAIQRARLIEELWHKIDQLEAAQAQLAQKERMERELELARQVQQSLLPKTFPRVPGYIFAARNEPARRVGGDFYDVIRLDDDRFGLAIADVSDKGMPAAVYMALTRSLLLAEARRDRSPRAVLYNVNRLLRELGEPGMFVSVFYGVIEASSRLLTYARAGHDFPLLLRGESVLALGGQGTVLGIVDQEHLQLSEERTVLALGDCLVLYTDGLTDVLAPDGQLYSLDQLKELLRSCATEHAQALCEATFAGLAEYRGPAEQFDDMTMLVAQVRSAE
jgi:serine phosphatase RsbU (regulator of sigma subunit)/GAF domain-containing protein